MAKFIDRLLKCGLGDFNIEDQDGQLHNASILHGDVVFVSDSLQILLQFCFVFRKESSGAVWSMLLCNPCKMKE